MTKDNTDERLQGLKAYLFSRNLKRPEEIINHNLKDFDKMENKIIDKYDLNNISPVYENLFNTEMLGSCNYRQYNLKRKD